MAAKVFLCSTCKNFRILSQKNIKLLHQSAVYNYSVLPSPSNNVKEYPEHIVNIVQSISKLTLLEVSHLNALLKKELNIQDAPMLPMTGMPVATPAVVESEPPKEEQTEFSVKLLKFDEASKVKLIKEIKNIIPEMNLVMAKKYVEGVPQLVKEKLSKADAEKMKAQLEAVGAVVEID
ncbi:large ribosomal subunit protein bL12m isoform X1 [Hydra vulgaris]|uniref:large ribosomal subunit protein bL12m isoform X1 n=1 Tax=Hydra vulgaris TaxID=6087 RepID=UPI0001926F9F|nr:39S ribosomal protein L12, mitochondrial [Hydra vulgaris]